VVTLSEVGCVLRLLLLLFRRLPLTSSAYGRSHRMNVGVNSISSFLWGQVIMFIYVALLDLSHQKEKK
jgi:hypothetical protein